MRTHHGAERERELTERALEVGEINVVDTPPVAIDRSSQEDGGEGGV